MWDAVVQANVEAMRVVDVGDKAEGFPAYHCGHYADWLLYGYFQQGRLRDAERVISACRKTDVESAAWVRAHPDVPIYGMKSAGRLHANLLRYDAGMREMAVIESRDWNGGLKGAAEVSSLKPEDGAWYEFTDGFAAAERGDLAAAGGALEAMRAKTEVYRSDKDADAQELQAMSVGLLELSGLIRMKRGAVEEGMTELRHAAEVYGGMAFAFGPPVTLVPPEELLGEVLLARGDWAGARGAFEQSLTRAPQRTKSLLGLARAERGAMDEPAARETYRTLFAIWHGADADAPGVAEARAAARAE